MSASPSPKAFLRTGSPGHEGRGWAERVVILGHQGAEGIRVVFIDLQTQPPQEVDVQLQNIAVMGSAVVGGRQMNYGRRSFSSFRHGQEFDRQRMPQGGNAGKIGVEKFQRDEPIENDVQRLVGSRPGLRDRRSARDWPRYGSRPCRTAMRKWPSGARCRVPRKTFFLSAVAEHREERRRASKQACAGFSFMSERDRS